MGKLTKSDREMYQIFMRDHGSCWACQVQPLPYIDAGMDLKALDNCHIAGGARRDNDRRNLVRNCKAHHKIQTNDQFAECRDAKVTIENMLWLKQRFDPDHFDLDYLRERLRHKSIEPKPLKPIGESR